MLEDDGRIDEKIFNEYTSLSLRYPPRFSQVSTEEEALRQLESVSFDLVICMPGTGDNDSFDIGRHIKEKYEQIPIVILTPFSHGITKLIYSWSEFGLNSSVWWPYFRIGCYLSLACFC